MPECYYSGAVFDEVVMSSASVTKPDVETCSVTHWETPSSLVYNEVGDSDWKDKQVRPRQEEEQVSVQLEDQYDEYLMMYSMCTVSMQPKDLCHSLYS